MWDNFIPASLKQKGELIFSEGHKSCATELTFLLLFQHGTTVSEFGIFGGRFSHGVQQS